MFAQIHFPLGLAISRHDASACSQQRNLSIVPDSPGQCYLKREAAPCRGETVIRSVLERGLPAWKSR
jgi:hypothetical protein